MRSDQELGRRGFITAVASGVILADVAKSQVRLSAEEPQDEVREVTPAEDLMFEHGVIERLLLIYEEAARWIDAGQEGAAKLIFDAASILRSFAEDYHEKLEEQFIFPHLEKDGRYADLAKTLRAQHLAGQKVTSSLLDMAQGGVLAQPQQAAQAMRAFYRMYIPHISRENSVAFRAFHDLVPPEEYDKLGEEFEEKERSLFGEDGFDKTMDRVAVIERELGIHDISQFTPE